jgi:hypothetical protein
MSLYQINGFFDDLNAMAQHLNQASQALTRQAQKNVTFLHRKGAEGVGTMKKIIITAVLFAVLLGVTGCMSIFSRRDDVGSGNAQQQQVGVIDAGLAHMEERYGLPFEFSSRVDGTPFGNANVRRFLVTTPSLPDEIFVEAIATESGREFRDNFLAVKFRQDMYEKIKSVANGVFTETIVFYNVSRRALSPELPVDSTFEEYSTDLRSGIIATVVVSENLFYEPLVATFAERFLDTNISATFRFVVLDEETINLLADMHIGEIIGQRKYQYFAVIMIQDGEITIEPREVN